MTASFTPRTLIRNNLRWPAGEKNGNVVLPSRFLTPGRADWGLHVRQENKTAPTYRKMNFAGFNAPSFTANERGTYFSLEYCRPTRIFSAMAKNAVNGIIAGDIRARVFFVAVNIRNALPYPSLGAILDRRPVPLRLRFIAVAVGMHEIP